MKLDAYSTRLLGRVHENPAPASRRWVFLRPLPWPAKRAVRLAWVQAYLDALGYTGEVSEARWDRSLQAHGPTALQRMWAQSASLEESEDALVEARRVLAVEDPQRLGAERTVDWRQVTEDAFRHWWDTSEDAGALLAYAARSISRSALVPLVTACARTALRYVPEGEARPRIALETAEAWARGEATLQQVRDAADAAGAYARTTDAAPAYAALSAAYATEAVYAASGAAAAGAAYDAASAHTSAFTVYGTRPWKTEREAALRALADLIRSQQPFPGW